VLDRRDWAMYDGDIPYWRRLTMMKWIFNGLRVWLPLGAAVTLMAGLIYLIDQQQIRLGGNNPQVQMAEDAAAAIAAGQTPQSLVPAAKIEISSSLSSYVMVFDTGGKLLASGAMLHGADPAVPAGIFDSVRQSGEDRVTWQPESGVRQAAVVVPVSGGPGGFVLAGRSMRELEALEDSQLLRVQLGWLVTMLVTLGLTLILEIPLFKRRLA
jgi:hypothetical protein